ncbi:MAG: sigma factor-like helix-turn-helix DNA-binding protein [Porcipelethomonas sp.]
MELSKMKNLDFALLLDIYGSMLTDRQRELMELYYWEDMSLGEISEGVGITRQAVRDGIKRGEQMLENLDSNLGFAGKAVKCREYFNAIAGYAAGKAESGDRVMKEIYDLAVNGRETF